MGTGDRPAWLEARVDPRWIDRDNFSPHRAGCYSSRPDSRTRKTAIHETSIQESEHLADRIWSSRSLGIDFLIVKLSRSIHERHLWNLSLHLGGHGVSDHVCQHIRRADRRPIVRQVQTSLYSSSCGTGRRSDFSPLIE